jgi:hypothetical protein
MILSLSCSFQVNFFVNSGPHLIERFNVGFQVVRDKVKHAVLFSGSGHHVVFLKHAYMVLDGLVVKAESLGELVHVVWLALQKVNDPDPVLAAPRSGEKKPEQPLGFRIGHLAASK